MAARERLAQNFGGKLLGLAFERPPILVRRAAHVNRSHLRIDCSNALHHPDTVELRHLDIGHHPIRWMMRIAIIAVNTVVRSMCFVAFCA